MFVGHGLLAFALVTLFGERFGWSRSLVLRVAVLAGLFATLPDIDVIYGPVGLLSVSAAEPELAESFWAAGNQAHRGVTHSLVIGAVTALAVGLLDRREPALSAVGIALLGSLVALAAAVSGGLGGVVALVFVVGAVALTQVGHYLWVPTQGVTVAAVVGLLSHPFGDLLTGAPPAFFYPFDVPLVSERVLLSGDPTLHLLGAFVVEIGVMWLALVAFFRLTDRRVRDHVDRRAALGVGYAAVAFVIPAPTLEISYQFVYSVLAFGIVTAIPRSVARFRTLRGLTTALATVSVASITYTCVYLLL